MSTLNEVLAKFEGGRFTANECAVQIVFAVPIEEFQRQIESVPAAVLEELAYISDASRRDRLMSRYGPTPTGEQLRPFADAIAKSRQGSERKRNGQA